MKPVALILTGAASVFLPASLAFGAEGAISICCVGDSITEGKKTGFLQEFTYRQYLPDILTENGLTGSRWVTGRLPPGPRDRFES